MKNKISLFLFVILLMCTTTSYQDVVRNEKKPIRQEVLVLRAGSKDSIDRNSIGRKILLKNLFPDWPDRVGYQKEQDKFYKSGQAKLQEARKLRISDKFALKFLTVQEKDASDYFNGTGSYENYQNPKTLPNTFDTRQSFLLKIENREVRKNFLNSCNNLFKKDN